MTDQRSILLYNLVSLLVGNHADERYEAFLSMTGSATCEEVVKQTLGEDLTNPEFWATALKAIEPSLVAYDAVCLE